MTCGKNQATCGQNRRVNEYSEVTKKIQSKILDLSNTAFDVNKEWKKDFVGNETFLGGLITLEDQSQLV